MSLDLHLLFLWGKVALKFKLCNVLHLGNLLLAHLAGATEIEH